MLKQKHRHRIFANRLLEKSYCVFQQPVRYSRKVFSPLFMLSLLISSHSFATGNFSFALIGDLPYKVKINQSDKAFNELVTQINLDRDLAWVLHVGDIKAGGSSCSDAFLIDRKKRFEKFEPVFILTPGDNEWTDCHRVSAGSYDPLERLTFLRELFFSTPHTALEQRVDMLQSQADHTAEFNLYRENIVWQFKSILFSTIHLVGSGNGSADFSPFSSIKRRKQHDREVKERLRAALHWLATSFTIAKKNDSKGVFIAIHANPGLFPQSDAQDREPFITFLRLLDKMAREFDKPVVLAHGDSHVFRIDKPHLSTKYAPQNFIRVETFGDNNASWIKVGVEPDSPGIFSFTPISN